MKSLHSRNFCIEIKAIKVMKAMKSIWLFMYKTGKKKMDYMKIIYTKDALLVCLHKQSSWQ